MTTTSLTDSQPSPAYEPLTEDVRPWLTAEVGVDRAARLVRNVALSGGVSRNGRRYAAEALRTAVPLYDGKPVFLDHAPNPARPHDRSMRDMVGTVREPRFVEGTIRGDIEVFDTDAGQTFLALVEGNSPAVGMSHVVLAQRGSESQVIERIHDVVSVDAVVFPATTAGFREADDTEPPTEAIYEQQQFDTLREQLAAITAERDQLLQECAAWKQRAESPRPTSRPRNTLQDDDQRFIATFRQSRPSALSGWE